MGKIRTELADGILTIVFDNPPDGYLDGPMTEALVGLLPRLRDDDVRVVVLTGAAEGVFIRHYSVEELKTLSDRLRAKGRTFDETSRVEDHPVNRIARALEDLDKPVIAAINGTAMGGGWELAMACDIRVVEAGPYPLGLPEVNLGILPGAGGTQRLGRLTGTARALELILRGRTVTPMEAVELGMAHEISTDAGKRAREIATELTRKPPRALAHIKRLVRSAQAGIDPELLQLESRLFLDLLVSDDANRRMAEFTAGKRGIRNG